MYSPDRLREVMKAQGRTNDWLAEMTDYDAATVARYRTGTLPISKKFADRAAKALGIPSSWLVEESVGLEQVPA